MAEQQTIKYAPQWNNMTMNNVTFQTNNVVGNFNYQPNVPAYKPIMKCLLNCPLRKAFTNCPSVVYQNFLREFWSTVVAYDPSPSTDETEQRPLMEFLIKFLVLNGKRPLTLDFNTFCSSTGLDYNNGKYVAHPAPEAVKKELGKITINPREIIYSDLVTKLPNKSRLKYVSYPRFISCALQVLLGSDYTQDENFRFLPGFLSNSNFIKDPSKVTNIELMAHMIAVISQKDSVSSLPLFVKPKKGKSQTVTLTLPTSQGLEVPGALSKNKRPMSEKPPTKTKVIPPKPTEGFEQSHLVSSGTVPDPQDLERNIQLTSMGLPFTLNEGTCTAKTAPRPEGSLGEKDSGGNLPPADMEPIHPNIANLSGIDVRAFLLSDNEAQESKEDILGAGEEIDEESQAASIAEAHHQSLPP
ncbi:hypothetical protein Tco_1015169 [Tanacetum coccineum]|uniref:Uncharacterized protein n=1 Tax=Tanacetum coccineum TaxID=301880 RepID=A0ABQ5FKK5_9ASTR